MRCGNLLDPGSRSESELLFLAWFSVTQRQRASFRRSRSRRKRRGGGGRRGRRRRRRGSYTSGEPSRKERRKPRRKSADLREPQHPAHRHELKQMNGSAATHVKVDSVSPFLNDSSRSRVRRLNRISESVNRTLRLSLL